MKYFVTLRVRPHVRRNLAREFLMPVLDPQALKDDQEALARLAAILGSTKAPKTAFLPLGRRRVLAHVKAEPTLPAQIRASRNFL